MSDSRALSTPNPSEDDRELLEARAALKARFEARLIEMGGQGHLDATTSVEHGHRCPEPKCNRPHVDEMQTWNPGYAAGMGKPN
jgi:hypothetical protein